MYVVSCNIILQVPKSAIINYRNYSQPRFAVRSEKEHTVMINFHTGKHHIGKRAVCLMLCTALFGGVWAGAADYTCSTCGSVHHITDVADIAETALPSVVSITNISVQEAQRYFDRFDRYGHNSTELKETTSVGSGIIFENTSDALYIVTNYHVVEGASTLSVGFVDDEVYNAQLCGVNSTKDIAVIKVPLSSLSASTRSKITVATLGDSSKLRVGEQVVAIGNALGYGQSVTTGIVSALNRSVQTGTDSNGKAVTATYLQTDAAINPGNSGGALLNMNGEVIGINTAKLSSTGVEGMGYAIPISDIKSMINQLKTQTTTTTVKKQSGTTVYYYYRSK